MIDACETISSLDSVYEELDADNPIPILRSWFEKARNFELNDPESAALATVGSSNWPEVRMVLVKGVNVGDLVVFTNLASKKGRDIAHLDRVSLLFYWKSLRRQVKINGEVAKISKIEADAYFAKRARGKQIAAWASKQSNVLESLEGLEEVAGKYENKFGGIEVPRPKYWSGFRVIPSVVEFWRHRGSRLHLRVEFIRQQVVPDLWRRRLLSP